MEVDELPAFQDESSRMKINNLPLRSCYQRISDSPQYNLKGIVNTSRKRRSVYSPISHSGLGKGDVTTNPGRTKREVVIVNYDSICDNIFNGATSTLAK